MLNILKNAVEAMPEGDLLTVEVQHRDYNVGVLVTDTGLGLTLAKRVFELHGGSVSLKGTKVGGTAVALTLPLVARIIFFMSSRRTPKPRPPIQAMTSYFGSSSERPARLNSPRC